MSPADRIEINPAVMMGKPVVRGTRVPIELIVRKVAQGASEQALLAAYPRLTADDIGTARTLYRICETTLSGNWPFSDPFSEMISPPRATLIFLWSFNRPLAWGCWDWRDCVVSSS